MKILFKKDNLKTTITTLLYLLLGVLFCVMPVRMFNFAETVLCALLLGTGIVCVAIYALLSHDDKPFKLLIYGIIAVVLAVLTLMWPRLFGVIVSIVIGSSGAMLIVEFIKNKKHGLKGNVTELVIGIVVSCLSVVAIILSGTNVSKNIISIFFGVICLTQAINGVVQAVILVKQNRKSEPQKTQKIEEKHIKNDEKSENIEK